VPQQTISYIESSEAPNVKLETLERVCAALGVPASFLLMDGVTPELLIDPRLARLIANYKKADDQARDWILRFSERESA
jgi:transcriptional regulator with XRE-family HTH domain